jgi:hypothetical protein
LLITHLHRQTLPLYERKRENKSLRREHRAADKLGHLKIFSFFLKIHNPILILFSHLYKVQTIPIPLPHAMLELFEHQQFRQQLVNEF